MPGKILRLLLKAYLVYLALALLVLLPVLNLAAPRLSAQYLDRRLDSELILFNPFTLALEVRGARLAEPDGRSFAAVERLEVDFSAWLSLVRPGMVLDDVAVEGLTLTLRRYESGRFNISDLLAGDPAADEASAGDGSLPAFTVRTILFDTRELRYEDHTRSPRYDTFLQDLAFTVTGLSTVLEEGSPYELLVVTQHNGTLRWHGEFSLPRAQSRGELEITDLDLRPFHRYLAEDLPFTLDSGLLALSGRYTATWADDGAVTVSDGALQLHAVALQPKDLQALPDTALAFDRFELDGIAVDSGRQHVSAAAATLRGLSVAGYLEDERISLQEMLIPSAAGDNRAADSGTAAVPDNNSEVEASELWQLRLGRFSLPDGRIRWRTPYTTPATLTVDPLHVELSELTYPPEGDSAVSVALTLNDEATLSAAGTVDAGAGGGALDLELAALPVTLANPLLGSVLNAAIEGGRLEASGELVLAAFAPETISGAMRLTDFDLLIAGAQQSALGWDSLAVPDITVAVPAQRLETGVISLNGYRTQLRIGEDGRLNVQTALVEEQGGEGSNDDSAESEAAEPWQLAFGGLAVRSSSVDFEDRSLPLDFRTLVEGLEGKVGALGTESPAPVPVSLTGAVDGYAPVRIEGQVAPFAAEPDVDIGVSFQGIDIARLTPYAGTYAGYTIDSGTLSLDLRYRLAGDRLQGENRAVISQMQLGEPFDSDRAMDLPLKLAIALLKDSRGVIDLDVPVEGDVNDPSFRLGKVIGRAIANVIVNIATAPFKLLAGLAGSSDDLQGLAFAPGSDALDAPAAGKLDALANALGKRPELKLLARGVSDDEDARVLREQALDAALLGDGLAPASLAARDAAWAEAVAARYAPAHGDADADTDAEPPAPAAQYDALAAAMTLPPRALETLATERATQVKRYLVTSRGIAAERVAISGGAGDSAVDRGVTLDVDA
ncbi:DUF748 domain-containing protein [Pseudohaliea rubra]|uniref:DUF748 domain-containing protein n=1 Tax=Pseudohaliea rubra DSM 19751 TaxID=1265313 RepID=A0A095VU46_9GAMM|nr:DUF748 domain-containing protein [Pseudohaliea rubra]KGE04895.1 hypothetical protein HRUBRA_00368 [Pseudohaliea rubra DSM 19751]